MSVDFSANLDLVHLRELCQLDHVPLIAFDSEKTSDNIIINMHPGSKQKARALNDLIIYLKWTQFVIIYQDSSSKFSNQKKNYFNFFF